MFYKLDSFDSSEKILFAIDHNVAEARNVREQIKHLKTVPDCTSEFLDNVLLEEERKEVSSMEEEEEKEDLDISLYLSRYSHLCYGYTEEEFLSCLPSLEDDFFLPILLRLKAESLKEMKALMEFSYQDKTLSLEERMSIDELIQCEKKKIEDLDRYMSHQEEEVNSDLGENEIVLMPTFGGKIRILEDLDHISSEFYPEILDLIQSIVNGTFKRIRKFNLKSNPVLGGICEVRSSWTRVLFQRIDRNTYAIISAFVKKAHNNTMYRDIVRVRAGEFKTVFLSLKNGLSDDEFLKMNALYVEELYRVLGDSFKDNPLVKENTL